ncbi:DUF6035 family protein [Geminocystis herdmanii]|uniref:DUF6035 family protein n=1 Tax=Geminocystis herdmanii TaxID=669359 RepID=UPI000349DC4B|nr:DUF6035 family protein [Geminocystis herdmanii]
MRDNYDFPEAIKNPYINTSLTNKKLINRTIQEVLNIQTGEYLSADYFFSLSEDVIFKGRRKLEEYNQREEKLLVCPFCYQSVKIRGNKTGKKSMHFSHLYDSGDCPIKTSNKYTEDEIRRMKYNGQKESERHKMLKNFIGEFLEKDNRFYDVRIERNFQDKGLSKEWKRPDVAAKFRDLDIVFEIQLSTTFLSVIVEREVFYQKNKTFIIWFFNQFHTQADEQKFTEKDIIYLNNNNAFVINNETILKSQQENKLIFLCYYEEAYIDKNNYIIKTDWTSEYITFDELKFDYINYKLYYYNTEKEKENLINELRNKLIIEFEKFWLDYIKFTAKYRRTKLDELQNLFYSQKTDVILNDMIHIDKLYPILNALYSFKYGRIINYNFPNFLALINYVLEDRKEYGKVLFSAIRYYNYEQLLLSADKKGTYRKKLNKSLDCEQDQKYNKLLKILFPELNQ